MEFRFYALKLSAICIIVFFIQIFVNGFTELFLLNELSLSQPWRFVTAIFLHGGLGHLLYNLFALALFGSFLESFIGSRNFLLVFMSTGVFANLIAFNFYPASLGASGAIFGVIGTLILVRPLLVVWAFGLPMPIFIAGILWAVGDFVGLFVPSNVGNIAHLSGMGFGLILGFLYRRIIPKERKEKSERAKLDENYMRRWEDAHLR